MKYNAALDGVRGIAILFVILFHYGFFGAGWIGVQLFFVLSGYLITSILLADKRRTTGEYFKRFYWRRSLRIFPLYYAYLLVLAAVWFVTGSPIEFGQRWGYLFGYVYNYALLLVPLRQSVAFTHFWSLAVEEQFYLFWPAVVFICSTRALGYIVAAIIAAAPLVRWGLVVLAYAMFPDHAQPGLFAYSPLPAQLDALAAGAALALIPAPSGRTSPLPVWIASGVAVAIGLVNLFAQFPGIMSEPGLTVLDRLTTLGYVAFSTANLQHVWSYTVINIWAALLIRYASATQTKGSMLAHPYLVQIGKISYGLYVLHYPILGLLKTAVYIRPFSVRSFVLFVPYVLVLFVVAFLSFEYFESWFLKWKDRRPAIPARA
jgi:peptidoglycan/LPS O-acetylase OafA/YrhL